MAQRADDRPRRVWIAEHLPVAQRDAGEQVQRVPEQRGLRRRADQQLPIDPRAVRNRALVEPPRVVLRRAAQPAAHRGVRPTQRGRDGPKPDPAALAASACPITSVASARRALSAPGSRICVAPHCAQRARREVTVSVATPRPRTVRVRACPCGRRVPAHRGQRIAPASRLSSARRGQDTTITDHDSVHARKGFLPHRRREGASSCGATPTVAPVVSSLPTTITARRPAAQPRPPTPSALDPRRPWPGDGADQAHSSGQAIDIVNDESLPGGRLPR